MRDRISLNGSWDFKPEPNKGEFQEWFDDTSDWPLQIKVPQAWELLLGFDANASCWYRKSFTKPNLKSDQRLWLHFEAAATNAIVYINGIEAGKHQGDWTPFEFDITNHIKEGENTVWVRVEEDDTHITRGFTCIAMPHHGGLWQEVYLEIRNAIIIQEPPYISCDFNNKLVHLQVCLNNCDEAIVETLITEKGSSEVIVKSETDAANGTAAVSLDASMLKPWFIGQGNIYEAHLKLYIHDELVDEITERFGFREVRTEGRRILLNNEPVYPRGWLTWGVYPDIIAPAPSPEEAAKEFKDMFEQGFNMTKNCLWLPPRHYYDIADEMGVLIWLEYPTWWSAPQFGPEMYEEMNELFIRDRNRPSIIIRSLTCEAPLTRPEPFDTEVFKGLYENAHKIIPQAIIIDNSGFFMHWAKVQPEMFTDAYSDHPYMDCHNFHEHLNALSELLDTLPPKPLITGESMDCDTWRSSANFRKKFGVKLPWWLEWDPENKPAPLFMTDVPTQEAREKQLAEELEFDLMKDVIDLSQKHARAHLKYQTETYRKNDHFTGFTLIGMRDSSGNTPGFYDDLGNLKHKPEDLAGWNNDTVLLFDNGTNHRNYECGKAYEINLMISCFDTQVKDSGKLRWSIDYGSYTIDSSTKPVIFKKGIPQIIETIYFTAPDLPKPGVFELIVELETEDKVIKNSWNMWIFPKPVFPAHSFLLEIDTRFACSYDLNHAHLDELPSTDSILITNFLNDDIINWISEGGRALITTQWTNNIPVEFSSMWREAHDVFVPSKALGDFPHEKFIDLQFNPLTSHIRIITDKVHGKADILVRRVNPRKFCGGEDLIQFTVGKGHALACSWNLAGEDNFTGSYLLSQLANYVTSDSCKPTKGFTAQELSTLVSETLPKEQN